MRLKYKPGDILKVIPDVEWSEQANTIVQIKNYVPNWDRFDYECHNITLDQGKYYRESHLVPLTKLEQALL